MHQAIKAGLVRACHDMSEGGLAVAAAEMAFAGGLGARVAVCGIPHEGRLSPTTLLFSESNTRFLCEVRPDNAGAFEAALADVPHARIGQVTDNGKLTILDEASTLVESDLKTLKEAWQKPLRW